MDMKRDVVLTLMRSLGSCNGFDCHCNTCLNVLGQRFGTVGWLV